jgi:hypothetical protein
LAWRAYPSQPLGQSKDYDQYDPGGKEDTDGC